MHEIIGSQILVTTRAVSTNLFLLAAMMRQLEGATATATTAKTKTTTTATARATTLEKNRHHISLMISNPHPASRPLALSPTRTHTL
jgi:hypothetical protein